MTATIDPIVAFKENQKQAWARFAPNESFTIPPAARLVRYARVRAGQRVLDVGCGTGVVAVTAARGGAHVAALDLTPELLERARENAQIAEVEVDWREGDAEALPFGDAEFDAVLSQFGHMFAPRPDVVTAEMLRVLKPGGTLAFSTWPPELLMGRTAALLASYLPPPPPGVSPPTQWGEPAIVRERLGAAVKDLEFDRAIMRMPVLSPQHHRAHTERTAGPFRKVAESLAATDPAKLETLRRQYEALVASYLHENVTRQSFLLTRATKV